MPYISLRVITSGGTPSTVNGSTVTVGTAGTVSLTQMRINTTAICTRGPSGQINWFGYVFSWTGAHPLGTAYSINATYQTSGTNDPQPLGVITATVISSTSLTVWLRATVGG